MDMGCIFVPFRCGLFKPDSIITLTLVRRNHFLSPDLRNVIDDASGEGQRLLPCHYLQDGGLVIDVDHLHVEAVSAAV